MPTGNLVLGGGPSQSPEAAGRHLRHGEQACCVPTAAFIPCSEFADLKEAGPNVRKYKDHFCINLDILTFLTFPDIRWYPDILFIASTQPAKFHDLPDDISCFDRRTPRAMDAPQRRGGVWLTHGSRQCRGTLDGSRHWWYW